MNERQSIYSMAMSHNGNTLVTGTTEKVCTLYVCERESKLNYQASLLFNLTANYHCVTVLWAMGVKVLRVWDVRSGQRQFKLRGHRDNIRALLINDDATLCISGI